MSATAAAWVLRAAWPCLAAFGAALALAGPTPEQLSERTALRAERAAVEARYRQAERDCAERFAVSACLNAAMTQRREALGALRQRELALDEAIRRSESEARAAHLAAREQAAAQRAASAASAAARSGSAASPSASGVPMPARSPSAGDRSASAAGSTWRRAVPGAAAASRPRPDERKAREATAAAERAAASQLRASEAQAHREAVERRNAERAAKGKKPADPLPVPSAASIAGR